MKCIDSVRNSNLGRQHEYSQIIIGVRSDEVQPTTPVSSSPKLKGTLLDQFEFDHLINSYNQQNIFVEWKKSIKQSLLKVSNPQKCNGQFFLRSKMQHFFKEYLNMSCSLLSSLHYLNCFHFQDLRGQTDPHCTYLSLSPPFSAPVSTQSHGSSTLVASTK